MIKVNEINLDFQGKLFAISSFLIDTSEGPVLIESGPYSTIKSLEIGVQNNGYQLSDIKHVLLTHIHLDHGGAAWYLAEQGATIHLHPLGYKHMHDPSKLLASAQKLYGSMMDELWGTLKPIPAEKLNQVEDNAQLSIGNRVFKAIYSPGHAVHHIAWKLDHVIFTGDVAGICINEGPVVPPCPPPDINIEDWIISIDRILTYEEVDTYYLTHGGKVQNCQIHMEKLRHMLRRYADFILPHYKKGTPVQDLIGPFNTFTKELLIKQGADQKDLDIYEGSNPSFMAVAGLMRYWKKKLEN